MIDSAAAIAPMMAQLSKVLFMSLAFRGLNAAAAVVDVSTDLRSAVISAATANKAVAVFVPLPVIDSRGTTTGS